MIFWQIPSLTNGPSAAFIPSGRALHPNLHARFDMRKAILPLLFATFLFAFVSPPGANADTWDKKTIVTFNQDVGIPGQVLPAGTYVFKLLRSGSDRYVVQVWTAHEEQLLATLITAGDSYPNLSGDAYFVLDMSGTEEGNPPAVASWFFAGGNEGRDFVYSGCSTSRLVTDQDTALVVPAPASSQVGVGVAISNPPPALPVYDQPVCPGDGYVWTPGYWDRADDSADYYWVPGTWVLAPEVAYSGPRVIGAGVVMPFSGTRVTGARKLDSTAGSITALAISASDLWEDAGITAASFTIAP
jgi:WXXGXW repeat (2 copies)